MADYQGYTQAPNLSMLAQQQFGASAPQGKPAQPGSMAGIGDTAKGLRQTLERISDHLRSHVDQIVGQPMATPASAGPGVAPRPVPNGLLAAIVEEHERADRACEQIDGQLARLGVALR